MFYPILALTALTSGIKQLYISEMDTNNKLFLLWLIVIVAVPLSPLNKREVLKTPYIQIWCRGGYVSAPH